MQTQLLCHNIFPYGSTNSQTSDHTTHDSSAALSRCGSASTNKCTTQLTNRNMHSDRSKWATTACSWAMDSRDCIRQGEATDIFSTGNLAAPLRSTSPTHSQRRVTDSRREEAARDRESPGSARPHVLSPACTPAARAEPLVQKQNTHTQKIPSFIHPGRHPSASRPPMCGCVTLVV